MLGDRRPLSTRLHDDLLQRIRQGSYQPGDRLPTEAELSDQYNVARTTVREALRSLEKDGYIEARQGSGRVITARPAISRPLNELEGVTEMLERQGFTPENRVLGVTVRAANSDEMQSLSRTDELKVVQLERLRLHREGRLEQPLIYSVDIIPQDIIGQPLDAVAWSTSLFALLEQWGHPVSFAVTELQAVQLDAPLARRLKLERKEPWLLFTQVHSGRDGTRVLYSRDYHSGSAFSFNLVRVRSRED
jgi:GntR family transcriptional regulator